MIDGNSGGATAAEVEAWVTQYGVKHPMVADPSGTTSAGLNGGYPTYPVIGPDMVIVNIDLYPFNCSGLQGYL